MAITATAIKAGANRLRYSLETVSTGTDTVTLTTADLRTALGTKQGALLKIVKAPTDGYGAFPAGGLSQAQARGLYLSQRFGLGPFSADPGELLPTAICRLTPRDATGVLSPGWFVDVGQVGGAPTITVTIVANGSDNNACYLDIYVPGVIGD